MKVKGVQGRVMIDCKAFMSKNTNGWLDYYEKYGF